MGMVELLLGAGDKVMDRPEKDFEVSRLSKLTGQPFLLHARALTMRELEDYNGQQNFKEKIILAAVTDPDFRDSRLAEMVKPANRKTPMTPIEVIQAVLQPGEIVNLYAGISELCGFGEDAVQEIEKN